MGDADVRDVRDVKLFFEKVEISRPIIAGTLVFYTVHAFDSNCMYRVCARPVAHKSNTRASESAQQT